MTIRASMVSTLDNPFNPFTQANEWERFDIDLGYNTMSYLSRIAILSEELSIDDYNQAINNAVDEIIDLNLTGNYIKVYEPITTTEKEFI